MKKCHECGIKNGVRRIKHLYPGGAAHISLTRAIDLCPACEKKKAASLNAVIESAKQQIKAHQQAKDEGQVALQLDGTLAIEQEQTEMDLGELPEVLNPMVRCFGPGPEGKQCKTCAFLCTNRPGQNKYYKCEKRGITNGPGTDHRVRWDACSLYKEG